MVLFAKVIGLLVKLPCNADRVIPKLYSVPMKKLLKEFYVIGGMPEAVKTWVETGSIEDVEVVLSEIQTRNRFQAISEEHCRKQS